MVTNVNKSLGEILEMKKLNLNILTLHEKEILLEKHVIPMLLEFKKEIKYPAKHSITKRDYGISSDNIISLMGKNTWAEVLEELGIMSRSQAKRPVRKKRRDNVYDWAMIDEWRKKEGLSYKEIIDRHHELYGCAPAKSTISHHYSATTASVSYDRQKKLRATVRGKISKKLDGFRFKNKSKPYQHSNKQDSVYKIIRIKLKGYRRKNMTTTRHSTDKVLIEDAIEHLEKTQQLDCRNWTCVSPLTGDIINLKEEFHLDHWDNDGGNTLDNLAILSRSENMLKGDFSIAELVEMCKKVITIHDQK